MIKQFISFLMQQQQLNSNFFADTCITFYSMMETFFPEAHIYLHEVHEFFLDAFATFGVPYAAEILYALVIMLLVFAVCRILQSLTSTLRFFVAIFCQFLFVFSACLLAHVVYFDHEKVIEAMQSKFDEVRSWY